MSEDAIQGGGTGSDPGPGGGADADVSAQNADFWNEPCGTQLARSAGITEITPATLAEFDERYFAYYPYLKPMLDRLPVAGADVLEIGLGFATVGQYLAGLAGSYTGVDIAEEPVGLLDLRLAATGLAGRGRAIQGSALALPFPDASFDVVVSIGTLHHTGDLERAVGEVRRVLRPGGQALVMVYYAQSLRRLLHILRTRVRAVFKGKDDGAAERLRSAYDSRTDGRAAPHTDFVSRREARRLFAGFSAVRMDVHNMDPYYLLGWRVVRRHWVLGNVDRVLGLDLYIVATR